MTNGITRRGFLRSLSAGSVCLANLAGCAEKTNPSLTSSTQPQGEGGGSDARQRRPNVLLITTDQQRKDSLSVYQSKSCPVATPTIGKIAMDGVVFDRAYIASTTCTPSRASILTGQYPSRHGAYSIGTTLSPDVMKLTDLLAEAGYVNYAVGKMHFTPVSTKGKFESPPNILDEAFWRSFDGPYYGFHHTALLNRHSSESLSCRMRYGVWLKQKGLTEEDLKQYFRNQNGRWALPVDCHPTTFVAESAAGSLRDHKSRHGDAPFFMWVSFQDPHRPHVVPAPYDTMYDPRKVPYLGYRAGEHDGRPEFYRELFLEPGKFLARFPGNEFGVPCASSAGNADGKKEEALRKEIAIHFGMVALIDEQLKKVIDALKETGQYDSTLIIYTSDHGDYLGNHGFLSKGFPAFEEVYNVPLIVKNAGGASAGRRSGELVSLVDLAPTVLSSVGCDVPKAMEGVDHAPSWQGKAGPIRQNLIIENRPIPAGFYQQMLITDRYKLVAYMDTPQGELYDMRRDPHQYDNLWNKQEHLDRKREMLIQLIARKPSGSDTPAELADLSAGELLRILWKKMHAEEPVQLRTSFS